MARMTRQQHDGSWFHVMNHAIGSKNLFVTDIDRATFLDYLGQAAHTPDFGVVAYCLMGNHFHLVVRAGGPAELSVSMQNVCSRYARAHNRRNRSDGPVFRSRFVSKPIVDDPQLLVTTRYVHRNPLELRMDMRSYPWSSYPNFIGRDSGSLIEPDLVLSLAGGPAAYRTFVESEHPSDEFHLRDGFRSVPSPLRTSVLDGLVSSAHRLGDPATVRSTRDAILIVALDAGLATSDEVAETLGLRSGAVVRSLASKARVKLGSDDQLTAAVRRLRSTLPQAA